MKISEWLECFDGHDAVDVEQTKVDFELKTGKIWPGITGRPVKDLLKEGKKDFKGLHVWNGKPTAFVVGAWVIASRLARDYANGFSAQSIGRGSAFWECVGALKKAGQ